MKKTFLALAALLTLTIAAGLPAQAQTLFVRVNVPFEFVVDGKPLPAGDYNIRTDNITGLLRIARADGSGDVVAVTSFNAGRDKSESVGSRVVFARYDNRYFLRTIYDAGRSTNRQLGESGTEREAKIAAVLRQSVTLLAKR